MDKARLNAGLAVHLFGWIYRKEYESTRFAGPLWQLPDGTTRTEAEDWAGTWEGMGQVVGAMRARTGWYEIAKSAVGGGHRACFTGNVKDVAFGRSAPEAVALAALRAIAPEVAEELERGNGDG